MAVPHHSVKAPRAGQPAEVRRRLEHRDGIAGLREAMGQGETEHPAPDDPPVTDHTHPTPDGIRFTDANPRSIATDLAQRTHHDIVWWVPSHPAAAPDSSGFSSIRSMLFVKATQDRLRS